MEKYLSFHLSYFDIKNNSPGSLLKRISINTMELNQLLNSILGISLKCFCIFVVSFIIGLHQNYKLFFFNFTNIILLFI